MMQKLNVKQWLAIGLLARLLVIPFTVHVDLFFNYSIPHLLSHGEWDAYGIAVNEIGQRYYPPLTLIFFAALQVVFRVLVPGYHDFIELIGEGNLKAIWEADGLFQILFLLKAPFLVFDGLLIWLCWKFFSDEGGRKVFTMLWACNPVVIYSVYMGGHFDLIPAFLVVLACYFSVNRDTGHYACLALAAGFLFKIFPIIFLPMVLCMTCKTAKEVFRNSLFALVPILIIYGGFYLVSGNAVFKIFVLGSLRVATQITVGTEIILLRILQAGVYFLACYHILFYQKDPLTPSLAIQYFLAVFLAMNWGILLLLTHYLIWVMPFLVIFVQHVRSWRKPFYVLLLIIFLAGMKSRASTLGVFSPLNHQFFMSFPSLGDVVGFLFDPKMYDFVIGALFKGLTGIMLFSIMQRLFVRAKPAERDS
ncbi:MAG: hypothetical protein VYC17_04475 [Nitrospinota bacterium]|nr:hypothetical protein [Nitrospinota bacterium]